MNILGGNSHLVHAARKDSVVRVFLVLQFQSMPFELISQFFDITIFLHNPSLQFLDFLKIFLPTGSLLKEII